MRVLSVLALPLLASACATTGTAGLAGTNVHDTRPNPAMVASMEPMAADPKPASAAEPEQVGDDSAGGLLERAFAQFNRDDYKASSKTFTLAIGTNNLNEAGRALAYWHIYLAEKRLSREDLATEALASFCEVGEEIMEARDNSRYAMTTASDFIERFNLDTRLSRARAILSATWAKRVPGYGQSAGDAVPVFDQAEADYFVEIAPPCANAKKRQTDKHTIVKQGHELQKVTLFCEGQKSGTDYFLEIVKN